MALCRLFCSDRVIFDWLLFGGASYSLCQTSLFVQKDYDYSGPSLKGHSLERTPLYKGHKFLAASTMNVRHAPSHQRTPL